MRVFFHRTWCSGTAAFARWSRYLAESGREHHKSTGCHWCSDTATLSWRLPVLESQTDNRHVNTVNRNSTIKDHDARECWICAMKSLPGSKCFHQTCWSRTSHAGGANECTVTTLFAAFSFGTKRYIKIVAATLDFRNRTSARVGILSQRRVFLLHDAPHPCRQPPGPCRRQPRQPPGASAPLRSATPLCCGAPTLSDGGCLSLLPLVSSSSGHTLSFCLWSHGSANRYHAEPRKEQVRHDEHGAEAGHELPSGPWTPVPPPLIAAYLRSQPLRLYGWGHWTSCRPSCGELASHCLFFQTHIFLQPTIQQFLPTAAQNSRIRPLRLQLLSVCN